MISAVFSVSKHVKQDPNGANFHDIRVQYSERVIIKFVYDGIFLSIEPKM